MATKKSLADQVLLRISRGYPDVSGAVQLPDVIMAVGQQINVLLKTQYFTQTLQLGETIPDGLNLVTYDDVKVYTLAPHGGLAARACCDLPAMPLSLPMGIGIYEVSSESNTYIPMLPGQSYLLKGQDFISDLLCNVGFEQKGKRIEFTKDITVDGVTKVKILMILSDISSMNEYEQLPIDPGMEETIVQALVVKFSSFQTNGDKVDSVNTEKITRS